MAEVRAAAHLAAPFSKHQLSSCESKAHVGERQTAPKPRVLTGPWELKSTVGMPLQEQCQAEHRCLGAGCTGFAFWSISGNFPGSGGSAAEGSITTAFCR